MALLRESRLRKDRHVNQQETIFNRKGKALQRSSLDREGDRGGDQFGYVRGVSEKNRIHVQKREGLSPLKTAERIDELGGTQQQC